MPLQRIAKPGHPDGVPVLQVRADQVVLCREMPVEGHLRHADPRSRAVDARGADAVPVEQRMGRVQQAVSGGRSCQPGEGDHTPIARQTCLHSHITARQTCQHQPFAFEVPMETRPPLPFTQHTAVQKVRLAEDGWNCATRPAWPWPHRRHTLAQPRRVPSGPRRRPAAAGAQVGTRTGLPPHQGVVGVQRPPHRRAVCLRMA